MQKASHVHRQSRRPGFGVILDGVTRPLRTPRASSEAGARRTPVRWDPIHGDPQDQPSRLTSSASSADVRNQEKEERQQPLTNS
jgi:hypothetical protein